MDLPEVGRGKLIEEEPGCVIIAGDWHGNLPWASSQLTFMRQLVPDEEPLIVLHLGDYGWWAPNAEFVMRTAKLAKQLNMRIWVTPGNHEWYPEMLTSRWLSSDPMADDRSLIALARGTRWQWHGRMWLSVGGAASADRAMRTRLSWWPEEELTDEEADRIISEGPADVLLTHDVGSAVPIDLGTWPASWGEEARLACLAHRERVQWLADGVKPSHWWHGHHHQCKRHDVEMNHGLVRVTGLSLDGTSGNWAIVDAKTMKLEYLSSVSHQER